MTSPTLYFNFAERYAENVELKAVWFGTEEATFNVLSNILRN